MRGRVLPVLASKNIYLTALHDRNEVLFYRLFSEHLCEMIPIVNELTVSLAMEQYHHECRRPRGVYLSIDHADAIEEAFGNLDAGSGDIDLIVFPLSKPAPWAEATPAELLAWTDGRGADRHGQPVRNGHAQGNHVCHRPDGLVG